MNFEMNTPFDFLEWTAQLLCLASLVHGCEFLRLRNATTSIWTTDALQNDFFGIKPSSTKQAFSLFLTPQFWNLLNILRIGSALITLWSPSFFGVLVLSLCHLMTLLRWRGTFNGGSDSMLLYVFMGTLLGMWPHQNPMGPKIALWFIALTLAYSYLKPGLLKLAHKNWRHGKALKTFLQSPAYQASAATSLITQKKGLLLFFAWGLILFETTFPLAFLSPSWAMIFVALGLCFHIGTSYVFGLNRFLFAWICAYPALIFCAGSYS